MKLLKNLVQIESLSGQEAKLADFIMTYCQKNSIPATKQAGNVIIHLKGKDRTKSLIFNAHMDTVGPGDSAKWKYPPAGKGAGKIVGGKLYGLGASDDKVAIAAMLSLAEKHLPGGPDVTSGTPGMVKESIKPPLDLWFTFVTREETSGSGTASFLTWFTASKYHKQYKKIAAIIGEPTGLKTLEIGHRGNAFYQLETNGLSGHAAKKYNDQDLAIEKMLKALFKLKQVVKIWETEYQDKILGKPTLNITALTAANDTPNKTAGVCTASLDIRTTPSLHGHLYAKLKKVLGREVKVTLAQVSRPSGMTSAKSPIVAAFQKAIPGISRTVSMGSTDICQFTQKGIDAVAFGPGEKEVIHKENEYCILEKVDQAVDIYKKVIGNF